MAFAFTSVGAMSPTGLFFAFICIAQAIVLCANTLDYITFNDILQTATGLLVPSSKIIEDLLNTGLDIYSIREVLLTVIGQDVNSTVYINIMNGNSSILHNIYTELTPVVRYSPEHGLDLGTIYILIDRLNIDDRAFRADAMVLYNLG